MDAEGRLYALFYTILHKGLEHYRFWLFAESWNQTPVDTEGWGLTAVRFGRSQKLHVGFWLESVLNLRIVQGSTVLGWTTWNCRYLTLYSLQSDTCIWFKVPPHFILTLAPLNRYSCPHFTDEKTKTQKWGWIINQWMLKTSFESCRQRNIQTCRKLYKNLFEPRFWRHF